MKNKTALVVFMLLLTAFSVLSAPVFACGGGGMSSEGGEKTTVVH